MPIKIIFNKSRVAICLLAYAVAQLALHAQEIEITVDEATLHKSYTALLIVDPFITEEAPIAAQIGLYIADNKVFHDVLKRNQDPQVLFDQSRQLRIANGQLFIGKNLQVYFSTKLSGKTYYYEIGQISDLKLRLHEGVQVKRKTLPHWKGEYKIVIPEEMSIVSSTVAEGSIITADELSLAYELMSLIKTFQHEHHTQIIEAPNREILTSFLQIQLPQNTVDLQPSEPQRDRMESIIRNQIRQSLGPSFSSAVNVRVTDATVTPSSLEAAPEFIFTSPTLDRINSDWLQSENQLNISINPLMHLYVGEGLKVYLQWDKWNFQVGTIKYVSDTLIHQDLKYKNLTLVWNDFRSTWFTRLDTSLTSDDPSIQSGIDQALSERAPYSGSFSELLDKVEEDSSQSALRCISYLLM